jgi:SAM-dependent methyltransferase
MSWFYRLAYAIGWKPWETAGQLERERVAAFFDREEQERVRPYGAALDLGCGTGLHAVELAKRGWQVTGVELVPKALRAARERARAAGVEVRFVEADVTALRASGIGPGFSLVLDFGVFHGLTDAQRRAMASEVTAVAAPGATQLMIAFVPGRRGPLPRGASRDEIEGTYDRWNVVAQDALPTSALPGFLRNADPRVYRLRHARAK